MYTSCNISYCTYVCMYLTHKQQESHIQQTLRAQALYQMHIKAGANYDARIRARTHTRAHRRTRWTSESRKHELSIFGYTRLPETYRRAAQCHQYACAHVPASTPLCDWQCRTIQKNQNEKKTLCLSALIEKAEVCWTSL